MIEVADSLDSRIYRLEQNLAKRVGVVEPLDETLRRQAEASDERFRQLKAAQLETTERLNALIHVVHERIGRGPRPGA